MPKVTGYLRTGEPGEMRFEQKLSSKGRLMWTQRSETASCSHLHCDYVNNETFDELVTEWFPCDWKKFRVVDDEAPAEPTQTTKWGDA